MRKVQVFALTAAMTVSVGAVGVRGLTATRDAETSTVRLRSGAVQLTGPGLFGTVTPSGGCEQCLYLVQFRGPVHDWHRQALRNLGAEVGDYIPDHAFLVRMDSRQAERVGKLDYVRGVGRYTATHKMDPALARARGDTTVRLVGFGGSVRGTVGSLAAAGSAVRDVGGRAVVATLKADQLGQLAGSEDVVWMEPVRTNKLFNDKATRTMKVDTAAWDTGLTGAGQVIGVADTGLDTGADDKNLHPDFQGRVQAVYSLGRRGDASDTHGHGTHVAGSVLGSGAGDGQARGAAPEAKLVFQSVLDSNGGLGGLPEDLGTLFGQAYEAGARIHSDSWGVPYDSGGNVYDAQSAAVDRMIWEHPDLAILFAAGNDGDHNQDGRVDYSTVSSPGTAKNAITVGASENNRPELGKHADNANSVAIFSSRGPAPDGRVKPDIVAPGSWILSAKSSRAPENNFWKGYNDRYAYMGGTSMATPLSAGATALVRQYFETKLGVTPRAALLKAALINGAADIEGTWKDHGWGRLDLAGTLKPFQFENESVALRTGESKGYSYQVKAGQPLKVTLVWSDYPASPSASKTLVNDLDLQVKTPDGKVLIGNAEALGQSSPDRLNNVETVAVAAPTTGTYTVTVKAENVPQGPQRFALVVGGNLGEGETTPPPQDPPTQPPVDKTPPTVKLTAPAAGATLSGSVKLSASAADDDSGVQQVEFYVGGTLAGKASATPYAVTWDSRSMANGSYQVYARAYDEAGNTAETSPVTVTVANDQAQPQPPAEGMLTQTFTGETNGYGMIRRTYFDVRGQGKVTALLDTNDTADVDVTIYDPWNRPILATRGGAAATSVNLPDAVNGTYQAVIRVNGGSGTYALTVTHPATGSMQQQQSGSVDATGARTARFTFQQKRRGALNVNLDWHGAADLDLYLLDAQGRLIDRAATGGTNPEVVSGLVRPGTYTVYVVANSGQADFTVTATRTK